MKRLLILFALLAVAASARASDWEATDSAMLGSALVMTSVDWAQTRYITRHPEQFHETNSVLGSHPSVGKVDKYFAAAMLGTVGLSIVLPATQRRWFLGGLLIIETAVVFNNQQIGIKADF